MKTKTFFLLIVVLLRATVLVAQDVNQTKVLDVVPGDEISTIAPKPYSITVGEYRDFLNSADLTADNQELYAPAIGSQIVLTSEDGQNNYEMANGVNSDDVMLGLTSVEMEAYSDWARNSLKISPLMMFDSDEGESSAAKKQDPRQITSRGDEQREVDNDGGSPNQIARGSDTAGIAEKTTDVKIGSTTSSMGNTSDAPNISKAVKIGGGKSLLFHPLAWITAACAITTAQADRKLVYSHSAYTYSNASYFAVTAWHDACRIDARASEACSSFKFATDGNISTDFSVAAKKAAWIKAFEAKKASFSALMNEMPLLMKDIAFAEKKIRDYKEQELFSLVSRKYPEGDLCYELKVKARCEEAQQSYNEACKVATEATDACFRTLDLVPHHSEQELLWEEAFKKAGGAKEAWTKSEAECQQALEQAKASSEKTDWYLNAMKFSENRSAEWIDGSAWHPSSYTEAFSKDLHEYNHACVIDHAEVDGPELSQKTRKMIIKAQSEHSYLCLEKVTDSSTGDVVAQKRIAADHIVVMLEDGEDPESFRSKLNHLDPNTRMEEVTDDAPIYLLYFSKISLRLLSKILEESRLIAQMSELSSLGRSSIDSYDTSLSHGSENEDLTLARSNQDSINILVPNDTNYTEQSNLKRIDASNGWAIQSSATNIVTAVIDSGIHQHDDLCKNMWNNSKPFQDYKAYEHEHGVTANSTWNIVPDDNHGTHIAGIIGAVGNNSRGIAGVVWKLPLMFCKAAIIEWRTGLMNHTSFMNWKDTNVMNCINRARLNNASIMNLSYNDDVRSNFILKELAAVRDYGAIIVASAGNRGRNIDTALSYPASYAKSLQNPNGLDNIVVVAATDDHDQLAPFSNYGARSVHLAAPGVNILSTVHTSNTSSYKRMSGTSMATPHVAGALALMMQQFPGKNYIWLIGKLLNATDIIPSLVNKTIYGRLNLAKALMPEEETCPAASNETEVKS